MGPVWQDEEGLAEDDFVKLDTDMRTCDPMHLLFYSSYHISYYN